MKCIYKRYRLRNKLCEEIGHEQAIHLAGVGGNRDDVDRELMAAATYFLPRQTNWFWNGDSSLIRLYFTM